MSNARRCATSTRSALSGLPTTWRNSRAVGSRCWPGEWRRFLPIRVSMPLWWPRQIIGTRRLPSSPVRRERMFTSRNRLATTFGRVANLSRRRGSTSASCKSAPRIGVPRIMSLRATTFSLANLATFAWSRCSTSRAAGRFISGKAGVHRKDFHGKPGWDRPRHGRITAASFMLVGIISGTTPAAIWPTAAFTSSTLR